MMKTENNNGNIEILAPCGSYDSIIAAVRKGADAVYIGSLKFSARAYAANFDNEQLKQAVSYCHLHSVKVHMAVNTLLKDNELEQALYTVKKACDAGVDAFIVQDLGLASLLKQMFPEIVLHASTQMTIHTPNGAKRAVILAAGGSAQKQLGTCGDGFRFAEQMGLTVKKPLPALVPLTVKKDPLFKAAGVRIHGKVSLHNQEGKQLQEMEGQLQLTDYGISGIPVFGVSQEALRRIDAKETIRAVLNFLPDFSRGEIEDQLKKTFEAGISYDPLDTKLSFVLSGIFPEKLAAVFIEKAGESSKMTLTELNALEEKDYHHFVREMAEVIHEYHLTVTGSRGFEQAQTTSGGVLLSRLDPKSLMDGKNPGFFLCGEVLDVDGVCGGYNLQWAFSSGYLAGRGAVDYIKEMDNYDQNR